MCPSCRMCIIGVHLSHLLLELKLKLLPNGAARHSGFQESYICHCRAAYMIA
jgi:hypothetical protein